MLNKLWRRLSILFTLTPIALLPNFASAGVFDLSGTMFYSASSYGTTGFQWKRGWEVSLGYYFMDLTEIQISAEDIVDRTMIQNIEDTTFHDQIYSVELVQSLLPKSAGFQPFVKAGIGQLIREANGTYASGAAPPILLGSLTGIVGVGLRLFVLQQFSIKTEATSYLRDGAVSTMADNISARFGFSFYF
jgi:hypothetical protein